MPDTIAPAKETPQDIIPASIFRAYDIRGVVNVELTPEAVRVIGQAIASEALDLKIETLLIGYDGRVSSPELSKQLIEGVLSTGCNVVDLGLIPTPMLYFAAHTCPFSSGVMLTASHNPANYNGLKIVFNQTCLADNQIQEIRARIEQGTLASGSGGYSKLDLRNSYVDDIRSRISLTRPLKLVIDCGNAVPAVIAPAVFEALGCEVTTLYCELDGSFPNHHPDPTVASNLHSLASTVVEEGADLGIAFDGDGDRLGVVSDTGEIISTDKLLMLLVNAIAPEYPGKPIIYDVKTSAAIPKLIAELGAVPIMHRSGHSFMKQKMLETDAPLGGEFAAHIFIKDRWYGFDDGIYTAARVVEYLSKQPHSCSAEFAGFQTPISTPELAIPVSDEEKFELMERIKNEANFTGAKISFLDGIRAEFDYGWGLVRASNTSPALLLRFEATSQDNLQLLQSSFKALILSVDDSLQINF